MRIAIILPYFGRFDSLFPLWLESCRYNANVDWLIFTDDRRAFAYPDNVHVHYMEFADLRQRVSDLYAADGFTPSLNSPYRLCNFKPAYADIFRPWLDGYDAWGFCDNDMVYGRLNLASAGSTTVKLSDDFRQMRMRIGQLGHFSFFPLTDESVNLYRMGGAYKIAFSTNLSLFFDERCFPLILKSAGYHTELIHIADLLPRHRTFHIHSIGAHHWLDTEHVFLWDAGRLYRCYIDADGTVAREEFAYIHFLKRPMKVASDLDMKRPVAIVPNSIFNISYDQLTPEFIHTYTRPGVFWQYWRNSFRPHVFRERLAKRLYLNRRIISLMEQMDSMIPVCDND